MVITILEAQVNPENADRLQSDFKEAIKDLESGIVETFLVRAAKDATIWRILTVWRDRQALDAMRKTAETPRGVLIFRAAAAEPSLTVYDVVKQGRMQASTPTIHNG